MAHPHAAQFFTPSFINNFLSESKSNKTNHTAQSEGAMNFRFHQTPRRAGLIYHLFFFVCEFAVRKRKYATHFAYFQGVREPQFGNLVSVPRLKMYRAMKPNALPYSTSLIQNGGKLCVGI